MTRRSGQVRLVAGLAAAFLIAARAMAPAPALAQSSDPIRIGFSLALTGPLAPNGKQALLGAKIWQEEINAKGGLLGRRVELVNYDDQSNPANIPGIYTKLLDIDKVDLVNGRLRHQSGGAGDSGRDAEGQGPDRPVRARRQQGVPLRPLLLDDFGRSQSEPVVHRRLLRGRRQRRNRSRRPSRWSPRTPSSRATPAKARGRTTGPTGSPSSTTRPSRPAPPISRRSSARCRPPMPIWSLSVPIR